MTAPEKIGDFRPAGNLTSLGLRVGEDRIDLDAWGALQRICCRLVNSNKDEGRSFSAHLLTTHPQNEHNVRKCRINILLRLLG
jgi:hypothetical protein